MTKDMGHRYWSKKGPISLERKEKKIKMTFVEMFDKHYGSGMHTLTYHLSDHMFAEIWIFRKLSFLDSSSYAYFNKHIKWAFGTIFSITWEQIMETVTVIKRNHERALSYKRTELDENLTRNRKRNKSSTEIGRILYVTRPQMQLNKWHKLLMPVSKESWQPDLCLDWWNDLRKLSCRYF